MRIVLDTNILVSAAIWDLSVASKRIAKCIEAGHECIISAHILEEFVRVLTRDFPDEPLAERLRFVRRVAKEVPVTRIERVVLDDVADDAVLATAIAANADYLVTYDKHLLILKHYKGVSIVTPEELRV
jgi:uncharacterized protein